MRANLGSACLVSPVSMGQGWWHRCVCLCLASMFMPGLQTQFIGLELPTELLPNHLILIYLNFSGAEDWGWSLVSAKHVYSTKSQTSSPLYLLSGRLPWFEYSVPLLSLCSILNRPLGVKRYLKGINAFFLGVTLCSGLWISNE